MTTIWAGIDSGKRAHHCVVVDHAGDVLLSRRVGNDEAGLLELIATVVELAAGGEVCWATDLNAGGAALLVALLAGHGQRVLYIPGRIVHHAAATYRGDGKTDAKDARIIADQARDALGTHMAGVFAENVPRDELANVTVPFLERYRDQRRPNERFGPFCRRVGVDLLRRELGNKQWSAQRPTQTTPTTLRRKGDGQ